MAASGAGTTTVRTRKGERNPQDSGMIVLLVFECKYTNTSAEDIVENIHEIITWLRTHTGEAPELPVTKRDLRRCERKKYTAKCVPLGAFAQLPFVKDLSEACLSAPAVQQPQALGSLQFFVNVVSNTLKLLATSPSVVECRMIVHNALDALAKRVQRLEKDECAAFYETKQCAQKVDITLSYKPGASHVKSDVPGMEMQIIPPITDGGRQCDVRVRFKSDGVIARILCSPDNLQSLCGRTLVVIKTIDSTAKVDVNVGTRALIAAAACGLLPDPGDPDEPYLNYVREVAELDIGGDDAIAQQLSLDGGIVMGSMAAVWDKFDAFTGNPNAKGVNIVSLFCNFMRTCAVYPLAPQQVALLELLTHGYNPIYLLGCIDEQFRAMQPNILRFDPLVQAAALLFLHAKPTPLLLRVKELRTVIRGAPPTIATNPFAVTALFYVLMDIFATPGHAFLPILMQWIKETSAALRDQGRSRMAAECVMGMVHSSCAIIEALLALVAMGCIETKPMAAPRKKRWPFEVISPTSCVSEALAADAPYLRTLAVAEEVLHEPDKAAFGHGKQLFMTNRLLHSGLVIRTSAANAKTGIIGLFAGMRPLPERVAEVRADLVDEKTKAIVALMNASEECFQSARFTLMAVIDYMKKKPFVPRTCTNPEYHARLLRGFEDRTGMRVSPLWIPYTTFLPADMLRPPTPFALAGANMPLAMKHVREYGTCLPTLSPLHVYQPRFYTEGTGAKTTLWLKCVSLSQTHGFIEMRWRVNSVVRALRIVCATAGDEITEQMAQTNADLAKMSPGGFHWFTDHDAVLIVCKETEMCDINARDLMLIERQKAEDAARSAACDAMAARTAERLREIERMAEEDNAKIEQKLLSARARLDDGTCEKVQAEGQAPAVPVVQQVLTMWEDVAPALQADEVHARIDSMLQQPPLPYAAPNTRESSDTDEDADDWDWEHAEKL